jgi:hypothetical protein
MITKEQEKNLILAANRLTRRAQYHFSKENNVKYYDGIYQDILQELLNAATKAVGVDALVILSLPSQDEIDEQIDKYAFRVPYDGSNNFYDEVALKHYKAGIEWLLSRIRGNGA